jgi:hypothetical protein
MVAMGLNPLAWFGETSRVWTGINSSPTIWSSRWLFLVFVLWMIWVVNCNWNKFQPYNLVEPMALFGICFMDDMGGN